MADRTVSVRLQAIVGPYSAAMAKATRDTKELKTSVTKMATDGDKGFQTLSTGALIAGTGMALGFGKMITTAAGFEKQMSGVKAVSGASSDQLKQLSDAALEAGASQQLAGVTASDAAAAEAELAKAGVSVSDMLNGALMGSLSLASAGQLDFAKAAEISAQAMNIFDLRGSQVSHVADVFAAAANKSATDVGQLGDAMKQGGLVAAQTGLSFEETTAALAMFSDNALVGSDAGTSLKTMLQRLTPQSKEAQELMDELGFSAYDASGEFVGLEGLAGELQDSLSGMTTEQRNATMATLFGSDAVRAANILYSEGAKGVEEYTEAVDDQGAAARMAREQNDNLAGDVEALGGAFESALIENGSKATGALRGLAQTATAAVNGFSAMPDPVQTTAVGFAAVATTGALALGAIGTMAPKLSDARKSLDKMGTAGQALNRNLGKIAGGMAVLGAGMAVWGAWETMMADARAEADKFKDEWRGSAMSSATDGIDAFRSKMETVRDLQQDLSSKQSSGWQIWDRDKNASLQQGSANLGEIGDEMEKIIRVADELSLKLGMSGDAALEFVLQQQSAGIDVLADDYKEVAQSLGETWTMTREGTVASQELGGAMGTLGDEVASVEEQVDAFRTSLDALYSQMFGVENAADALQSSMNALPDLLAEARDEGLNLNDTLTSQSDAAIGVRGHMREMITAATDLIGEWRAQGIEGQELTTRIGTLSQSFRDQAEAAGVPAPVVDHYLGLLDRIPSNVSTVVNLSVNANMGSLYAELRNAAAAVDNFNATKGVRLNVYRGQGAVRGATGGLVPQYRSAGGPVLSVSPDFGPRGVDTVPLWAAPGEFVQQKSAVDKYGIEFMSKLNAGTIPTSAPMTRVGGGSTTTVIHRTYQITASALAASDVARTVRDAVIEIDRRGI